jgi:hypothetical protein
VEQEDYKEKMEEKEEGEESISYIGATLLEIQLTVQLRQLHPTGYSEEMEELCSYAFITPRRTPYQHAGFGGRFLGVLPSLVFSVGSRGYTQEFHGFSSRDSPHASLIICGFHYAPSLPSFKGVSQKSEAVVLSS